MSFRNATARWLRALAAICAIVGPVLLLVTACVGLYDWHFIRHAASTTGTVIQFDERPDEDEDGDAIDDKAASYAPVFTFNVDGEAYTVHSGSSAKLPAFSVGQQVPVLYDPDDSEHAKIDLAGTRWSREIRFGVTGIITTVIGAGGMVSRRRRASVAREA